MYISKIISQFQLQFNSFAFVYPIQHDYSLSVPVQVAPIMYLKNIRRISTFQAKALCQSSLVTPDEGHSLETSKLSLYFSGSCIPTNESLFKLIKQYFMGVRVPLFPDKMLCCLLILSTILLTKNTQETNFIFRFRLPSFYSQQLAIFKTDNQLSIAIKQSVYQ